ncbi:MAG: hypothetical protein JWN44_7051 [Myxococcales bacterium]|nr:hypothetical protein [Myxococcales bacterium]
MAQFEAARLSFAQLLRARGLSDRRGLYLKIGAHTYYSVLSFGRFAELDRVRADRVRALAKIDKSLTDEYDRLSDDGLTFPHASEIWSEAPGLSYLPTGRRLTEAVQVVIEDVKPTADYEAAWKPIAEALKKAQYPVERRTYFSSYGSGRTLSFWLAPSVAVVKAAPTLLQAVSSVVGAEKATALLDAWRACVTSSQELDVEARPEMSAY